MQIPIEIKIDKRREVYIYHHKIVVVCGRYDQFFIEDIKQLISKATSFSHLISLLKSRKRKYHFNIINNTNGYYRYGLFKYNFNYNVSAKKEESKKVKIELNKEDYEKLKKAIQEIEKRKKLNEKSFQKAVGKSVYSSINDLIEVSRKYFNL